MKYKEFISYGLIIDRTKFEEIKDHPRVEYLEKPLGGLWCSPVNSEWGWKDWCLSESYRTEKLETWTKFILSSSAKILEIDSLFDLIRIGKKYGKVRDSWDHRCIISFEKIKNDGYNGIFLSERGNSQCHFPLCEMPMDIDLNAWDCESMILFDLDHIKITEIKEV